MRTVKCIVEYEGTRYRGWQAQNAGGGRVRGARDTVQAALERVLGKILQEKITIFGAGRTDSGVHALGQAAHFKTKSRMPFVELTRAVNALLPEDIAVRTMREVASDFHARFCARSKLYRYTIWNSGEKIVFNRALCFRYPYKLNIALMQREARVLVGRHDFKSFQAADKKERTSVRTVTKLTIRKKDGFVHFEIEANGFLYKMVRSIVGTLLEIGRGRFTEGSARLILMRKQRKYAGPTVPAKGLCLIKVNY